MELRRCYSHSHKKIAKKLKINDSSKICHRIKATGQPTTFRIGKRQKITRLKYAYNILLSLMRSVLKDSVSSELDWNFTIIKLTWGGKLPI